MIALLGNLLVLLAVAMLLHVFAARVIGEEWIFVGDVLGAMVLFLGGGVFLRNRGTGRGRRRDRSGGEEG